MSTCTERCSRLVDAVERKIRGLENRSVEIINMKQTEEEEVGTGGSVEMAVWAVPGKCRSTETATWAESCPVTVLDWWHRLRAWLFQGRLGW